MIRPSYLRILIVPGGAQDAGALSLHEGSPPLVR